MIRRFGILSVGALLTLSLTTGCVVTGDPVQQVRPDDIAQQPGPPTPLPHALHIPTVTQAPQPEAPVVLTPPKPPPPPEPDVLPVKSQAPPEPLPLETTSRAVRPTPADTDPPLVAIMRCVIDKHPAEARELLQKYDKRSQDVLVALLPFAARVADGGLDQASPSEVTNLMVELDQIRAALRARTPLSIDKVCYCRRISNYGLYDPLPDDHVFAGGSRNHGELVQLYVEARNFAIRQNGKIYDTALASKLEIRDANCGLVARMDFPARPDRSLSPRQDYFIHYQFYVPAQMEPGNYTLTIELADENTTGDAPSRTTKRSLPFHVGGNVNRAAH
jgi:hypothetical protein